MNPHDQFCPNSSCPARGKTGESNIVVHSRKEARYKCTLCNKTFAATTGTPFYRLHHSVELMVIVMTLIAHGCPLQAIVAAYHLDERTVMDWQKEVGQHCKRVHEHLVQQPRAARLGEELGAEADQRPRRDEILHPHPPGAVVHHLLHAALAQGEELAEVHEALMKLNLNQHTLAGSIEQWRSNDAGEIHLINARIGALQEDGARRLQMLERLCTDMEAMSGSFPGEKAPRRGFRYWLFGTDDWIKASWRPRSKE